MLDSPTPTDKKRFGARRPASIAAVSSSSASSRRPTRISDHAWAVRVTSSAAPRPLAGETSITRWQSAIARSWRSSTLSVQPTHSPRSSRLASSASSSASKPVAARSVASPAGSRGSSAPARSGRQQRPRAARGPGCVAPSSASSPQRSISRGGSGTRDRRRARASAAPPRPIRCPPAGCAPPSSRASASRWRPSRCSTPAQYATTETRAGCCWGRRSSTTQSALRLASS